MRLRKYLFFIILFFAFVCRAQDKSDINDDKKVVAKLGKDYIVTLKELKDYVSDWKYDQRYKVKYEAYKNALNDLIINQLKIFDFFDRGLNENQALMKKIRRNINNELMDVFFDKNFVQKYSDEKMAAEAYKAMDKEIVINEIILPFNADSTKEKYDSLKAIALKIENRLSKDDNINKILKPYFSKDIHINYQKKISWSESMVDPVANVVFSLKIGFTRVIESIDGFHIVKIMDINKVNLAPFEAIKDEIISTLQKGFFQVYNKEYDNFRNGLIDKKSIKWNQSALDQIVKWSKSDETFYGSVYKDTIQNEISKGNNFEILTYNRGTVDLKEYLRLLDEVVILHRNIVLNSGSVKDFIIEAVYNDNVVKATQKLGMEKKLVSPDTRDAVIKDRLLYLYNQKVIDGSIPSATPEALQKFYDEQKDSVFYQLNKVNIYARIYSDSTKAAADINEIKQGTPFEKVSNSWWNKAYIRERDGSLNSYRSNEPPYLAKAAFKLGLNDVAGPVEYDDSSKGKQFAVIKCIYLQPEKLLTFDEVKGKRIEEEYTKYFRQKISDEVDKMLRKKYDIVIYENTLSGAI